MLLTLLIACQDSDYTVTELLPKLSVTPTDVDFGAVPAGVAETRVVSAVNTGEAALTFADPQITVSGGGTLEVSVDPLTLDPDGVGEITLTYTPAAEEVDSGDVLIADTTDLSSTIHWTGSGVVGALIVSPASVDFGPVLIAEQADQVVALQNIGLAPVTVSDLHLADTSPGFTVRPLVGALPLSIAPGGTAAVQVSYLAPSLDPAHDALTIVSDAPNAPSVDVPLSANTYIPNNRPVISLVTPAEGDTVSYGQTYTLRAFALDAETPAADLEVSFDSALLGPLGVTHPSPSGEVLLDTTATVIGDDTITATVVDADGGSNFDDANIVITDCDELSWDRSETFDSTFDDTLFALNGGASVDEALGEVILTDAVAWQGGAIYLKTPILLERFHVETRFRIDLGTGADGLAIVAAAGADPTKMLGRTGEQMGVGNITGVSGFVVEVDVHQNGARLDPAADHIALVSLPDYQHIGTPYELPDIENGVAHELVVDFNLGEIEVSLDGVVVLTETVPDWVAFEGYLGATAATGALYNKHALERWDVLTGCW